MRTIPYLTPNYDPRTGMPRKKIRGTLYPGQPVTGLAGPAGGPGGGQIPGGLFGGGPGSITTPGYTPDYKSLIEQALAPLNAQLGAEGSADASTRNAQLIRGIGQFGEQFDPKAALDAFGKDFYSQAGLEGLLPQANTLAAENTKAGFSVSSKLKTALERSVQQIQNALAARGLLRSGAYGTALEGANQEFRQGQYDARQSLTDYLTSAQQGYVAGERARQEKLLAAGREEAPRQAQLNPPQGTVEVPFAGTDPVTGKPYYRKPDGSLWNPDGTPYTPAAAPTPTPAPTPLTPPAAEKPGDIGDWQDILSRALTNIVPGQRLGTV